MIPEPFRAGVPQPVLDDPCARLARTRRLDATAGAGRRPGTASASLRRSCAHRGEGFDRRAQGDGLCANPIRHRATETIGSSCRLYAEAFANRDAQIPPERGRVPVGVAVFPRDILPAPRAWAERWLDPVHRTEAPRGGHFPAREQPDLLRADIRAFAGAPR